MFIKIIRNDFLKTKFVTISTMLFITAAAMLISLALILMINLTGALDTLMTQAKTPHFMQMHLGEIDVDRLKAFVDENNYVEAFQIVEFLNVEGAQILLGDRSLANSVQDNGLSTQNKLFDFLLDLDGNIINVFDGQVYVPINYLKDQTTKIGDKAVINGIEFTVSGFLRDSMMNSSLSASKRFLVSENDYAKIANEQNVEYLIEFRVNDISKLGELEAAYVSAGLEMNGPTVTFALFKIMNALSDGMMIGLIIIVSMLVVMIAFMCIRFTLLAKIEDDYREIGFMKAIGLRVSDVKKIYLAKYTTIAAYGSLIGFLLSVLVKDMLLENIRLFMGESSLASYATVSGGIAVLLTFLVIIAYIWLVLNRFRRISAADAIRYGISQDEHVGSSKLTLGKNKFLNTNVFLGIKDVLVRKKIYVTMLSVLVISTFIIIVPLNLYNTISSKNFINYMGIGNYDLRIQVNNPSENDIDYLIQVIDQDKNVYQHTVFMTKSYKVKTAEGLEENIKIELGNHSIFEINYIQGNAPTSETEIALSFINAENLGKNVGDTLTLILDGKEKELLVCGIYSDITNGGKTAKAIFTDDTTDIIWSILCVELSDKSIVEKMVIDYASMFEFAKVSDVREFVYQTFGSTINSIEIAAYASIIVSLVVTVLITLLFIKMLIAKDRYSVAVMKAFGFTNLDIQVQYLARSVFVLGVGILLGTLLANTLGELIAGRVIASFGAASFSFTIDPIWAYLISPLLMMMAVFVSTLAGTWHAGKIKISDNIKE